MILDFSGWQTCQVLALVRLRLYAEAQRRIDGLGDLDSTEYSYEAHGETYPGESGSMVPFTLRLLWAELPVLVATDSTGDKETMSRLHQLHTMTKRMLDSRSLPDSAEEDRYSCMSTLDAVSRIEDTTEAWADRRIRTVLALVGRYSAKQNFTAAVQLLQKVPSWTV